MKKLFAAVLCLAAALMLTACRDFKYDDDKVLTKYVGKGGDVIIPEGVTEIGRMSFYDCSALKSVVIPDGVTAIGGYAFNGCTNLTSVTIPDSVTMIGEDAFGNCTSLKSVEIPNGVTNISHMAFAHCTNLSEIKIPESVKEFGINVFYNTPWLEKKQKQDPLVIVNGVLIDGRICSGDVVIPNGVNSISKSVFYGCKDLESVTVPEGVTKIDHGSFENCPYLKSVILPDSLTYVYNDAFADSKNVVVTYKGVTYGYEQLDDFFRELPDNKPRW